MQDYGIAEKYLNAMLGIQSILSNVDGMIGQILMDRDCLMKLRDALVDKLGLKFQKIEEFQGEASQVEVLNSFSEAIVMY